MTVSKHDWDYEQSRLKSVCERIQHELGEKRADAKAYKEDVVNVRKSMWENTAHSSAEFEQMIEIRPYLDMMKQGEARHRFTSGIIRKLEKMLESPYFARVDFQEADSRCPEQIYIGLASFYDVDTGDIFIYDWRAPISSIFYEYELGPAEYALQDETVVGDVSLKRQFRIFNSKIHYMFDSSIKIDDDILQEILSKNVDDKMRNIVTSIQKEQNAVIRNDENNLIIVQGAAGSGKTSIALHRVAYLLYRYREEKISVNNIVIFSPNQLFNDYISNVLPELGEENVQQTTFIEYAERFLSRAYKLEDMAEQMEYLLSAYKEEGYEDRIHTIRYKASKEYLQLIKNYIGLLEREGMTFRDVKFGDQLIMSKEDAAERFYEDYKNYPVSIRLKKIRARITSILEPMQAERIKEVQEELLDKGAFPEEIESQARLQVFGEFKEVREAVDAMLHFDVYGAYYRLFRDEKLFRRAAEGTQMPENFEAMKSLMLKSQESRILYYEDVSPLLYLKGSLEGVPNLTEIRHVLIDEVQDYTPVQFEIFKQLFPRSNITMLGDLHQSIHPYMHADNYEMITKIFDAPDSAITRLTKSYRSSQEIAEFTRGILPQSYEIEYIHRSGGKPKLFWASKETDMLKHLVQHITELKEAGMKSIAVICKTAAKSGEVYDYLKDKTDIGLVAKDDAQFKKGAVIIPSYLAKGLEFDAVIIYDVSEDNYGRENERKLLYTACTRALHKLHMYYSGGLSHFIGDLDRGLYEAVEI